MARGGRATVDRMRLRCRAHNQYEAERAFGAEFMNGKRHEGRLAKKRVHVRVEVDEQFQDLLAGLRGLGCSAYEARRAAECSRTEGATLEERLRAALKFLPRRSFQGGDVGWWVRTCTANVNDRGPPRARSGDALRASRRLRREGPRRRYPDCFRAIAARFAASSQPRMRRFTYPVTATFAETIGPGWADCCTTTR